MEEGPRTPFYPDHLFKEIIVSFLLLTAILVLAIYWNVPTEPPADSTDANYIPRPEWYFLFLYEIYKFFGGKWMVVGTVIIPFLAISLLLFLPLIDRSFFRRPINRPLAMGIMGALLAGFVFLTLIGATSHPRPERLLAPERPLTPLEVAGMAIYNEKGCPACHSILGRGEKEGPDLWQVGRRRKGEWLSRLLQDPRSLIPDSKMLKYRLPSEDIQALVGYLLSLDFTQYGPVFMEKEVALGGWVFYKKGCPDCHQIHGFGGEKGPELSLWARQRKADELRQYMGEGLHRRVPDRTWNLLSQREKEALLAYLSSLK